MQQNKESADLLNDFIAWKREKDLYPSRHTPEDYLEEMAQKDARIRMNKIADYLLSLDPAEYLDQSGHEALSRIHSYVFQSLDFIDEEDVGMLDE